MDYETNMKVDITEYLQDNKNQAIKKVLTILDMSEIRREDKQQVRKAVLDAFNEVYLSTCKVLTFIQEDENAKSA